MWSRDRKKVHELVLIDDDDKKSTAVYRERLYHEITKLKKVRN